MRNLITACAVALLTSFSFGGAAQAAQGLTVQVVRDHDWHHHHRWDRSWHRYWHHGHYRHHHHRCFVRRYVTYRYGERVVHVNRICR